MTESLWRQSAGELAKAIREKDVSSREVVAAHLARIAAVNPRINAVTEVLEASALAGADAADRALAAGEQPGPLHGVPVTLKQNLDLAGSATSHAVAALKDAVAEKDVPIVAHLKRAGAVPIARTNLPEFGLRWHTDNALYGATLNPWDPGRTPGGSSGGEAAALATGMSPLGVGGDMGGSLRYPAFCCGIAALKPGFGRISRVATDLFTEPPLFYEQFAAVQGPMARRIADLRLALAIMSGPDPGDPWWTPAPASETAGTEPPRVAVSRAPGCEEPAPAIAAAVGKAADALADAGYAVEDIEPPGLEEAARIIPCIADLEMRSYLSGIKEMMSERDGAYLDTLIASGGATPDLPTYMAAIGARHALARDWSRFLADRPLVLGPVSTRPPFQVGEDLAGPEPLDRIIRSLRLTEVCNLLGLPSVALPVGIEGGLPQGVQIIGPRLREELCLDAAEAIEERLGILTPIDPRHAPTAEGRATD